MGIRATVIAKAYAAVDIAVAGAMPFAQKRFHQG